MYRVTLLNASAFKKTTGMEGGCTEQTTHLDRSYMETLGYLHIYDLRGRRKFRLHTRPVFIMALVYHMGFLRGLLGRGGGEMEIVAAPHI